MDAAYKNDQLSALLETYKAILEHDTNVAFLHRAGTPGWGGRYFGYECLGAIWYHGMPLLAVTTDGYMVRPLPEWRRLDALRDRLGREYDREAVGK